MKSGLEGRNKDEPLPDAIDLLAVSMKSGLEGRNKSGQLGGNFSALMSQ